MYIETSIEHISDKQNFHYDYFQSHSSSPPYEEDWENEESKLIGKLKMNYSHQNIIKTELVFFSLRNSLA